MIKQDQYHNIGFDDETQKKLSSYKEYDGTLRFANNTFQEVVLKLATDNPTWRIVICRSYPVNNAIKIEAVVVTIDGERVGYIQSDYVRGNYGVRIAGHKIEDAKRTGNPDRALSICRKAFVKRNTVERIKNAESEAASTLNNVRYKMQSAHHWHQSAMYKIALDYALNKAREDFARQLLESEKQELQQYEEASAHMVTIEAVKQAFEAKNTVLIIRDGGRYIAKTGDDVALYTSAELPEHIKGKVGMLKLCEDGQMVDNIGCRVNEEVFVVLVDKEGASNA